MNVSGADIQRIIEDWHRLGSRGLLSAYIAERIVAGVAEEVDEQPAPAQFAQQFTQITGAGEDLFALDGEGCVWKYIPRREGFGKNGERRTQWAFWTQITAYRKVRQ